jgi:C4-dicarboxylate transporter, DctM subunit
MDPQTVGYLSIAILVLLFGIGVPIGYTMLIVGMTGAVSMIGMRGAFALLGGTVWSSLNNYTLTVIPLFVLMGHFAYYSGFGGDLFYTIRKLIGNIRGSLSIAACLGCAAFGTVTGDSISTTITIGKISIPEMRKAGYDTRLAIGTMASSAPIAAMIPPSVLMALYGMVVEQSIGKLLVAGFLPGILTAIIFSLTIWIWVRLKPEMAPVTHEKISLVEKIKSLRHVWVVLACALMVLGGIYTGVFTPTEAGGMAALLVLLAGVLTRRLNLDKIWHAVMDSAKVMGTLAIIIIGTTMFNSMFAMTGISKILVNLLAPEGVSPIFFLIGFVALFLVLGCFMSAVAMIFLTMPFLFPVVLKLGISPIWFGVLVVHMAEVGSITPPFGITLFAVKSIMPENISTKTIMGSIGPFFLAYMVVTAILLAFPQIALFLPSLMK